MLILELSSIVLEIPDKTQSRVLQADWLILENNEKATLNITTLILLYYYMYLQLNHSITLSGENPSLDEMIQWMIPDFKVIT